MLGMAVEGGVDAVEIAKNLRVIRSRQGYALAQWSRIAKEMRDQDIAHRKSLESHLKTRNETLKWDDATIGRILQNSADVQAVDNAVFDEMAKRQGPDAQVFADDAWGAVLGLLHWPGSFTSWTMT